MNTPQDKQTCFKAVWRDSEQERLVLSSNSVSLNNKRPYVWEIGRPIFSRYKTLSTRVDVYQSRKLAKEQ